ncbi:MAG: hypothetical protein AB9903_11500 [Vulcanimicrobiota bacterium]
MLINSIRGGESIPGRWGVPESVSDEEFRIEDVEDEGIHYKKIRGTEGDDLIMVKQKGSGELLVSMNGEEKTIPSKYAANLWIDGKEGNDTIVCENPHVKLNNVVIIGGEGDDTIKAPDAENTVIRGGDDRDVMVAGRTGTTTIEGGRGNDVLIGGPGNDFLAGDAGNDILYGGDGDDILYGGEGKDVIQPGYGKDYIGFLDPGDILLKSPEENEYLIAGN